MALSGDCAPQFTTLAKFVRELRSEITELFTQVLLTCDAQCLIGCQMFAIGGVKLPSHAAKKKSGTHAELTRQAERMETSVAANAHGSGSEHEALLPMVARQPQATVEPAFGNLRHNKRLDRCTLRGQAKVNTQWHLFCLVHNIEKLAHHG